MSATLAPPSPWTANSLRSLGPTALTQFQKGLTQAEKVDLFFRWSFWARPDQLAPPSDYYVWLILAGRGFGKTRAGAEWVRAKIESGKYGRIALIGQTAADVRDVMVQGESGILAVSPPWCYPKYEPSKRRLTWPNGAIATTYSGDEPDQLRGPQHDAAWCLAGDTLVLLADGTEKPIRDIRAGDMVQTRQGPKHVTAQVLTKRQAQVYLLQTVDGRDIIGTADHLFWVNGRGFLPLSSLTEGMSLCATPVSSGTAKPGILKATAITASLSDCIGRFGRRRTARFRKAATSTTRTGIKRTTVLKTWNCSRMESIVHSTTKRNSRRIGLRLLQTRLLRGRETGRSASVSGLCIALNAASNIEAGHRFRPVTARRSASKRLVPARFKASKGNATSARPNTLPQRGLNGSALGRATVVPAKRGKRVSRRKIYSALSANSRFSRIDRTHGFAIDNAPCLSMDVIRSVEKLAQPYDVYDISIADVHEFFAHGLLVHNCDEPAKWRYLQEAWDNLEMGLRLGDNPQAVATTTPRPITWLRNLIRDEQTHVSSGKTLDNRANLSPRAVERMLRKYAGTRLGRQELDGEILDDNPNALWKRELDIEKHRVSAKDVPPLVRIVVGVDPQAADHEEGDESGAETGIIVAGVTGGDEPHAFVLDDCSLRDSPNKWASAVVDAYVTHKADRVVAEQNNGGAMVEFTVRTVARDKGVNVAYAGVHASRGKLTRAEPVAALYEQGKVHHVGAFAALEDQMCNWLPGQPSPDRMDALVWVLTELMLGDGDNKIQRVSQKRRAAYGFS